ncbi:M1 family metallopeptidase [Tahibacter amnicola]|uniref:Aminopeptidase N n=2 Tax=Tahibacter amnicola TaxID=2976241 RepID=A0ABY6BS67_9GAMM|nr:M1 family metallopeptidase [Tahibacter amnicola]UXI70617.1 M1 family metallopeptidase [Tahibacter amnicola]
MTLCAVPAYAANDPQSYAQTDKVRIRALKLDLDVAFDKRQLSGTAELSLDWRDKKALELRLDTRDLTIAKVEALDASGKAIPATFTLAPRDALYGSALTIALKEQVPSVRITYATSPEASGLQWLTPEQTAGKKKPFLFSQSQAIHARSWVPLQDTPGVRFTYTADVKVPKALRAVMSADNDPAHALDGKFHFTMDKAIPSYLMALSVGDLAVKSTGPRTAVYAEPSMVEKAAKEFEDTEKMIVATEKLYGAYPWGRYDILVLPPSFPFGGMENPRMTFATPTVVVGDKSLVSLVAHELAHSWSGNLVTNSTWKDIWLNEGFTSYVESRIVESVYGRELADMEDVISQFGLRQELATLEPADQLLMLAPQDGRDPDAVLSDVPYIKGQWFLTFLEQRFGREHFDPFVRSYFEHFAFQSIDSEQFLAYLREKLVTKFPGKVTEAELDAWLKKPGIPDFATAATSKRFEAIDAARADWLAGKVAAKAIKSTGWSTQEWVRFVEALPEKLDTRQLTELDEAFHFTGTANGEIAQRWYPLTVRSGYVAARPAIEKFLIGIGRRKLILPTWEALAATPDGHAFATAVFAKAKPGYHPITTASVTTTLEKARKK